MEAVSFTCNQRMSPTAVAIIQRQVRSAADNYHYKKLLRAEVIKLTFLAMFNTHIILLLLANFTVFTSLLLRPTYKVSRS